MHQFKNEPYYKDTDGYIAPLSEWINMLKDDNEMNSCTSFDIDSAEEYISKLVPVAKVDGRWLECNK